LQRYSPSSKRDSWKRPSSGRPPEHSPASAGTGLESSERLRFVMCLLPFREPVFAALAVALEFHHSSTASRADQIDDRGDDVRCICFRQCLNDSHAFPILPVFALASS